MDIFAYTYNFVAPAAAPEFFATAPRETPPVQPWCQSDLTGVSQEALLATPEDPGFMNRLQQGLQGAYCSEPEWGPQQQEPGDPSVAVFDDFNGTPGQTPHGNEVTSVLGQSEGPGGAPICRYETNGNASVKPLLDPHQNLGKNLNQYIQARYVNLLDSTSSNLENVLGNPYSNVRTINQSQSVSQGKLVENLNDMATQNPGFRARLEHTLGLHKGASQAEFLKALVSRVHTSVAGNRRIARAKQRYDVLSSYAAKRGISHVVTPGNLGDLAQQLKASGVKVPGDFYDNALNNRQAIVVGATDGNGHAASFTTPHGGVKVSADGVDIPSYANGSAQAVDGTSFAAPQVSATIARMQEINPNLNPAQIQQILRNSSQNLGDHSELGAGQLRPDVALALAYMSRLTAA